MEHDAALYNGIMRKNEKSKRLLLSLDILKSLEKDGAGTTDDIFARNIGGSLSDLESALSYLTNTEDVYFKNTRYGKLWIRNRAKVESPKNEIKTTKKPIRKKFSDQFLEYSEEAQNIIKRCEERPELAEERDERRRQIGWTKSSVAFSRGGRSVALRCLLALDGWVSASKLTELLGESQKYWRPILRGLVVDGIVYTKHSGKNIKCLYSAKCKNKEKTSKNKKERFYVVIKSRSWKDVYTISKESKISTSYARLLLSELYKRDLVERATIANNKVLWRGIQ